MDMLSNLKGALMGLAFVALAATAASAQAADAADAPLVPGDRLVIKIWLDTTLVDTMRVDQAAMVTLPRIGALSLHQVPASRAADSVRSAYSRVTRTPAIEVTPLRRVTVGGEVNDPGVYFVETHTTLREAVAAAGGITDIGSTGYLVLMRGDQESNVRRWERRADADVVVQSGDVIWIRREPWLKRNVFSVISGAGVLISLILSLTR